MIEALAWLTIPAALAVIAYHMVVPNHRNLRISVARFLPEFPQSSRQQRRFRLRLPPLTSVFALRVLICGCLCLAWLQILPKLDLDPTRVAGLRVVIDVSPSMTVPLPDRTARDSRLAAASDIVNETLQRIEDRGLIPPGCLDLISAGEVPRSVAAGALEDMLPRIAAFVAEPHGSSPTALRTALSLPQSPRCAASHTLVISDRPSPLGGLDAFAGPVCWRQVGSPVPNAALTQAHLVGGQFGGAVPKLRVTVTQFGDGPTPRVRLSGPNGIQEQDLFPDVGEGRFSGSFDVRPGTYQIERLAPDALDLDDRILAEVPAFQTLALDWRMPGPKPSFARTAETSDPIVVLPYLPNQPLPEQRFIALFRTGPDNNEAQIGPFLHEDPLLRGLDFDVFEAQPPAVIPPRTGLTPVLRTSDGDAAWILKRPNVRGVIIPDTYGSENGTAVAQLLFFNALRWVAGASDQEFRAQHVDPSGQPVRNVLAESDTTRPMQAPSDCADVFDVDPSGDPLAEDGPSDLIMFLLLTAGLALILERLFGLHWQRRAEP